MKSPSLKTRIGPAGVHFFNRLTGDNVLVNELILPERYWSQAPRNVAIALTNACDLRCPYCYAPKNNSQLSAAKVVEWVSDLDEKGTLGIGFGGGEPTLFDGFTQLCREVTTGTGVAVSFTTHGHRINARLAKELAGNVNFIRVSMDGVGKTYEALRHRSFTDLLQRLRVVSDICAFGINYVVNEATVGQLSHALDIAYEMKAAEFLLLPEQPARGRKGINNATEESMKRWIESSDTPIRLSISEAGKVPVLCCDPLQEEMGLRAYAHIDASGTLKRSSFATSGVKIGVDGIMTCVKKLRRMEA